MRVRSRETSLLFLKSLSALINILFLVLQFYNAFIPIPVFFHIIYVGLKIFKELLLFTNLCSTAYVISIHVKFIFSVTAR